MPDDLDMEKDMPSEMRKAHLKDATLRALRNARENLGDLERLCQQPGGKPPGLERLLRSGRRKLEEIEGKVKDIPITAGERMMKKGGR